ncbi:hypothetical protein M409DRAFT_62398 [Zasmidium cellare ATCC 36951]|uniref:aldehyde dehydrogenase (NAD(+)) n=1 Tax=Zasmidium cellare ATCC 36951 TaxID=1080233 RepID=A0A6A6D382_ZASCE|nr:uncharacterized protein M409DRAFT_62398 [Zasmidium cellare ATCC 36951]KAF2172642.1 hypothetical protein M409DRAFT_62398 [Zasmidium cellare ATCC 36951]
MPRDSVDKPAHIEDKLFINGEFVPSISGKKFEILDPTTDEVAASVYEAGVEDVDRAVEAAENAFPAWSELPASERAAYMLKLADALEDVVPEIGYMDAVTMGKPYVGSPVTHHSIQNLRYLAGQARDVFGETSLSTPGKLALSLRQPFGVCAAIIPWNGPLMMLINKVGAALVAGNTLVLKSSEKAPFTALIVARLCKQIGLPPGVLNILSGYGTSCGEALAKHMRVRRISFTGSVATGKLIQKASAESNLKKVALELGGKNPMLVFDDADVTLAARGATMATLINTGQGCILTTRIYVHSKIVDGFVEELKKGVAAAGEPGDPLVPGTRRGPQADQTQLRRVVGLIEDGRRNNYDIALGGKGRIGDKGCYVEPTIFVNVPEDAKVMREEVFGPVVCVTTFTDEADVIRRANDTEFGLYASVFTKDLSRAVRVAKAFEAGLVGVNCTSPAGLSEDLAFGGWKQSGSGRENGRRAVEAWTEEKSIMISL